MPGLQLQVSGFVLQKFPPTDRFQQFVLFSAEQGLLHCFQRLSSKQPVAALDLFDEVGGSLTSSNQGHTWFFSETRVLRRFNGIALNFAALQEASAFVALLARTPVHEESRAAVIRLLGVALESWSNGARADIVALKTYYTFARDEGYPVKEDWAAGLRGSDHDLARELLNQPLAAVVNADADQTARLLESLRRYLRGHHEIE